MGEGYLRWYLLQIKTNQHERALSNLASQNFECCSPTLAKSKLSRKKTTAKVEPLFPGYIFIRLQVECNWQAIGATRGVKGFVRFGQYPFVVPDKVVDNLTVNIESFRSRIKKMKTLKAGDTVTVSESGFDSLEAVYKCSAGRDRSLVLIRYLNALHEVNVRTDRLVRTSRA